VHQRHHRLAYTGIVSAVVVVVGLLALLARRLWAIPLVVIGGLVVVAVTAASAITSGRESLSAHRESA
jgi:hypothetical protein